MEELAQLGRLLRDRNKIEDEITSLIFRPATRGHIGEFIASRVFRIRLHETATRKGSDGHFEDGPLARKTVNVKFYGKQEGILDLTTGTLPDYYLVLTGPASPAQSSRGVSRPAVIEHVYLFSSSEISDDIQRRNVKGGIATSIRKEFWERAEIFPSSANSALPLTAEQRVLLTQFSSSTGAHQMTGADAAASPECDGTVFASHVTGVSGLITRQGQECTRSLGGRSASTEPTLPSKSGERTARETVLEVGCEGGTVTIVRVRVPDRAWRYLALRNESALADFLDDEDRQKLRLSDESKGVGSFIEALALIERYPWVMLEPLKLQREYQETVLAEVRRRGGAREVARWREALSRYSSSG